MNNSQLPQGHKIRVLTTFENGGSRQEVLNDDVYVCTLKELVIVGIQTGRFVRRDVLDQKVGIALELLNKAIELVNKPEFVKQQESGDALFFSQIHDAIMTLERHLNNI